MTLTPPDEHFNHQAPFPHATVASSDPSWRERCWISFHDVERQDAIVTCGMGKYPNADVMEAFVSVAHAGGQRNLRLSRQLTPESHVLRVGPLTLQVEEPFRTLRLTLDENESGIALDLLWHATMQPLLEGRHFQVSRGRVTHDLVRYVQMGCVEGRLQTPEGMFALTPDRWFSARDHSWGLRPKRRVEGAPPDASPEWRLLMFCPIQFASFCLHIYLYEARPGQPVHLSAALGGPIDGGEAGDVIVGVEHALEWVADAPIPTLAGGRLLLRLASGATREIAITARTPRVYLRGGGYGVDHGDWKGESALEHERWDLGDAEALRRYVSASSDHAIEARCDGETGHGIIEYVVLRGYPRYPDAQKKR